jgi:hypothetical protein
MKLKAAKAWAGYCRVHLGQFWPKTALIVHPWSTSRSVSRWIKTSHLSSSSQNHSPQSHFSAAETHKRQRESRGDDERQQLGWVEDGNACIEVIAALPAGSFTGARAHPRVSAPLSSRSTMVLLIADPGDHNNQRAMAAPCCSTRSVSVVDPLCGSETPSGGGPTEPLPGGWLQAQTGVVAEVRPGRPFLRVGVWCLKTFDLFDSYPIWTEKPIPLLLTSLLLI